MECPETSPYLVGVGAVSGLSYCLPRADCPPAGFQILLMDAMEGILFLLYWSFVIVVVFCLLRLAGIQLLAVSIPSLLIGTFLAYAWLGLPILFFHLDPHRLDVDDQETIWLLAAYAGLSFSILAAGMFLGSRMFGGIRLPSRNTGVVTIRSMNMVTIGIVLLLVGVCVVVAYLYISALPGIPLMASLSGDVDLAKVLRSRSTNEFEGKLWRYQLFTHTLSPFLVYICFAQAMVRRTIFWWLVFLVPLATTLMSLMIDTQKGPIVNLLIGLLCVSFLTRDRAIRPGFLVGAIVAILAVAVMQYRVLFVGEHFEFFELLARVASRVFCGQIHPAYFYVEVFPEYMQHLNGATFPNPMRILPFEHVNLSYMVMDYMKGPDDTVEIVGSAPTAFWGEAFANFGIYGVAIISLLIGVGIHVVQLLADRMQNSALRAATIGWLAMHFSRLSVAGFSGFLFDVKLVTVVTLAIILNDLNRLGSASRAEADVLEGNRGRTATCDPSNPAIAFQRSTF